MSQMTRGVDAVTYRAEGFVLARDGQPVMDGETPMIFKDEKRVRVYVSLNSEGDGEKWTMVPVTVTTEIKDRRAKQ